jgi:hypothetical protein
MSSTLYFEDFEDGAQGWSDTKTETLTNGDTVLGEFDGANDVEKTFDLNGDFQSLTLSFDFIELDSWDNENFSIYVNGQRVSFGKFRGDTNNDGTRAGANTSGFNWSMTSEAPTDLNTPGWDDQIHHITLTITNAAILAADELTVKFDARTDGSIDDEGYAIDNLKIEGDHRSVELVAKENFQGKSNTARVYDNGTEISATTLNLGAPGKVLGRFDGTENVVMSYRLPEYTGMVEIEFDFFELDTWNNEDFSIHVNGTKVSLGDFHYSVNEGSRQGSTDGIAWEMTSSALTHYSNTNSNYDQKHHVKMFVPAEHLGNDFVQIEFDSGTNEARTNESYALDNVKVNASPLKTVLVARDTFDADSEGWSSDKLDVDNDFTHGAFLGRFSGTQSVTKVFDIPAASEELKLTFDFLEIDSWDGEKFKVKINGHWINLGTFQHNIGEANATGVHANSGIEWTRAAEAAPAHLGFNGHKDQVHRFELTIPASIATDHKLSVTFKGELSSGVNDESWGIDNVELTADLDYLQPSNRSWTTIASQNFNNNGWAPGLTDVTAGANNHLGRFSGAQDVTFGQTFNTYDLKSGGQIEFLFTQFDTWDNEEFVLTINGRQVSLGSFRGGNVLDGDRTGTQNGFSWSMTSIKHENIAYGAAKDETHKVVLSFGEDELKGHVLNVTFDARLNGGIGDESYGIDNFKLLGYSDQVISGQASPTGTKKQFMEGHVNKGSVLDAGGKLVRGEALVSDDYSTALYLGLNGRLRLLHDDDGDGHYETMKAVFSGTDDTIFDEVSFRESDGALVGKKADGSLVEWVNDNPGETHVGYKALMSRQGVSAIEKDGSLISTVETDGVIKDYADDLTPDILAWDRFEGGRDAGWAMTQSADDADWLAGKRVALTPVNRASNDPGYQGQVSSDADYTKLLTLTNAQGDVPIDFQFAFQDRSNDEHIRISLGNMSNEWVNAGATKTDHQLLFDLNNLQGNRDFDPFAGDNDLEGKSRVIVEGNGHGERVVTIRVYDPKILPVNGGWPVVREGDSFNLPVTMKVHVDVGSNGSVNRAQLAEFKVTQHGKFSKLDVRNAQNEAGNSMEDFYSEFVNLELVQLNDGTTLEDLANSMSLSLGAQKKALSEIRSAMDTNAYADFDFNFYKGVAGSGGSSAVKTYHDSLLEIMDDLTDFHNGGSQYASMERYNDLLWNQLNDTMTQSQQAALRQGLAYAGFAVALSATVPWFALAFDGTLAASAGVEAATAEQGVAFTSFGKDVLTGVADTDVLSEPATYMDIRRMFKDTAGTEEFLSDPAKANLGWLQFVTDRGGLLTIATSNFIAGMPGADYAKTMFQYAEAEGLVDVLGSAVRTFTNSAVDFAEEHSSQTTNVDTFLGYAEDVEKAYDDFVDAAAESGANSTALATVWERILPHNRLDTLFDGKGVDEHRSINQEAFQWEQLGFKAEVSDQQSVTIPGHRKTKITVSDNPNGFDLAGIESFEYYVNHDFYSDRDEVVPLHEYHSFKIYDEVS